MSEQAFSFDATLENFQQYVIDNSHHVPVLVDFWAPWCGPCQSLMPMLTALAQRYQGAFLLAKVNIDEQQELAMQFAVRSVPTVKLIRNGEVVDEFLGALPESQITEFLDRHVEKESDKQITAIMEAFSAGQHQQALSQLQALRQQDPDSLPLLLCESEFLQELGRFDEALALFNSLPANLATEEEAIAAKSRLQLAMEAAAAPAEEELLKRLAANPEDHQARYQLANRYSGERRYEDALETFFELLRRSPQYEDEAARKGMLRVFDQLGGQGELVSRYRRKMFTAMH